MAQIRVQPVVLWHESTELDDVAHPDLRPGLDRVIAPLKRAGWVYGHLLLTRIRPRVLVAR